MRIAEPESVGVLAYVVLTSPDEAEALAWVEDPGLHSRGVVGDLVLDRGRACVGGRVCVVESRAELPCSATAPKGVVGCHWEAESICEV